jgi:hypothetical protein
LCQMQRVFEPFLSLRGTQSAISDYTVILSRRSCPVMTCLILMAAYLMVNVPQWVREGQEAENLAAGRSLQQVALATA